MKRKIIVVAGPTACGKTETSVEICRILGGEVISADSMQIYRGMDIGTAKASPQEMKSIPHFLIDELDPWEEYSAAEFVRKAGKYIADISERGNIPVVTGGTGFYINALLTDNDFGGAREKNTEIREELLRRLSENGAEYMYGLLKKTDPEYAESVHPNNTKRVIRGLEFFKETGEKLSHHNAEEKKKESCYDSRIFVLYMDREKLYERINKRVDIMLEKGLEAEVRGLLEKGIKRDAVSMQGLGYKELAEYICGEISFDEAVYKLKRDTRHFAKRQLTWFRHQLKDALWINVCDFENAAEIGKFVAKRTEKWIK